VVLLRSGWFRGPPWPAGPGDRDEHRAPGRRDASAPREGLLVL